MTRTAGDVDLTRLDNDALYTIILLHEREIEWFQADRDRLLAELKRRGEERIR